MKDLDSNDVEQMVRLFNIDVNRMNLGNGAMFTIPMFGVRVVFNIPSYKYDLPNWWYVVITPTDNLEEKRFETLWQLMRGGYFVYLRSEYPNTFRQMLSNLNYDRRIIDKRLAIYADKPKYAYFKAMNIAGRAMSANFILSADPGFFDFLQEEQV